MIYVDTSVVLAHVLAEDRIPPSALWDQPLISSRLTQYETWCRLHARRQAERPRAGGKDRRVARGEAVELVGDAGGGARGAGGEDAAAQARGVAGLAIRWARFRGCRWRS